MKPSAKRQKRETPGMYMNEGDQSDPEEGDYFAPFHRSIPLSSATNSMTSQGTSSSSSNNNNNNNNEQEEGNKEEEEEKETESELAIYDWYHQLLSRQFGYDIQDYPDDHPYVLLGEFPTRSWLDKFEPLYGDYKQGKPGAKEQIHRLMTSIMIETRIAVQRRYYILDGKTISLDRIPTTTNLNNIFYGVPLPTSLDDWKKKIMQQHGQLYQTNIKVQAKDTVTCAIDFKRDNPSSCPVVMNMASHKRPGGGYMRGHWAQEESLMRRSNYYQYLSDLDQTCLPKQWKYPIPEFGCIYSSNITFFRGEERSGYPFLSDPFELDFIAVAAYVDPEKNQIENWQIKTQTKIRTFFQVALENGHDSLILGALGKVLLPSFKDPKNTELNIFCLLSK